MTIDVYSDIACPWCYIGEQRLRDALTARPDVGAVPRWRPFLLQPDMPPAGLPWRPFAEAKFGGWEQALRIFSNVQAAAEADGIRFNFEGIVMAANTADAHRLILLAAEDGLEWDVAHRLFRAYFEEGRDVGNRDTLLAIAEEASLDRQRVVGYLDSGEGREEIQRSLSEAASLGIRGVPCFVFDGRAAVSGAQSSEVLIEVMDRLAADDDG